MYFWGGFHVINKKSRIIVRWKENSIFLPSVNTALKSCGNECKNQGRNLWMYRYEKFSPMSISNIYAALMDHMTGQIQHGRPRETQTVNLNKHQLLISARFILSDRCFNKTWLASTGTVVSQSCVFLIGIKFPQHDADTTVFHHGWTVCSGGNLFSMPVEMWKFFVSSDRIIFWTSFRGSKVHGAVHKMLHFSSALRWSIT